jgi:hypothetical protein
MAFTYGDDEQQRTVDRIRAIAYREAMYAGATFINRKWIATKVRRSETWVTDNWKKHFEDCFTSFGEGRPLKLSQESRDVVETSGGKRRRSNCDVAKVILESRGKRVDPRTIGRYRERMGFVAYHVRPKPMKTLLNIENRLWFCEFVSDWSEEDFLHLAPSDEFYIWSMRRPNIQNDRVWSRSLNEITADERYQEMSKHPNCVGIFVCFTALRMMWIVKEQGDSWTGEYFRESVLKNAVVPFLNNRRNVLSVKDVCFLHDKAPCFTANATQDLLTKSGLDLFTATECPGASPDLNAAEHFGAVLKDKVESLMIQE